MFYEKAPQRKREHWNLSYVALVLLTACATAPPPTPTDPKYVALNDRVPQFRVKAIREVNDQAVLTQIAANAETIEERVAAIDRLTNEGELIRLFEQAETFHERSVASNNISDDTWLALRSEADASHASQESSGTSNETIDDVFALEPEEDHASLARVPRERELENIESVRSSYLGGMSSDYTRLGWIIADLGLLLRSEPTDSPLAALALNYEGRVEQRQLADLVEVKSRRYATGGLPFVISRSAPFDATADWYYYALGFFDGEHAVAIREWETQIERDIDRLIGDKNFLRTNKPPMDYRNVVTELFDRIALSEQHLLRIATTSLSLLGREAAILKLGDGDVAFRQMHLEWNTIPPKQVGLFRAKLTQVLDDAQRVVIARTDFGSLYDGQVRSAAVMGIENEAYLQALSRWSGKDDVEFRLSDGAELRLKEGGPRYANWQSLNLLKRAIQARQDYFLCLRGEGCRAGNERWYRAPDDSVF